MPHKIQTSRLLAICWMLISALIFSAHGATPDKPANNSPVKLNIDITTHLGDQQVFVEHDVISFLISLDKAAYLYAFYQDAAGQVTQILPGKAMPEHFFQPGQYLPFPSANSGLQFQVQKPFGEEQLWVFGSDNGEIQFHDVNATTGIAQVAFKQSELENYIRAKSALLFGTAALVIHTRRQ